ncbi:uncharacterized protein J3D65DRAFT_600932 [Phyllosticta citribraziliensis]|uniref:Uncharacterized protein n=1 Tax=Phyllosticta citribraziliensis TaxID=989973 RepID=A0ABR1M038_9PEZI
MEWSKIVGMTASVVVIVILVLECHGPRGRTTLYERVGFIFCKCPWGVVKRAGTLLRRCGECVVERAEAWWRQRQWLQQLQQEQRRQERQESATNMGRGGEESGVADAGVASGMRLPLDRPPTYQSDLPPPRYDGEESVDTLPRYYDDDDDYEEEEEEEEEESEVDLGEANWMRFPGRRLSEETSSTVITDGMTGDLADGHAQMRWE